MKLVQPHEHQVLILLVQLTVLLLTARLLGQAARRCGLPAVVGELAAGVVVGPSVVGKIAPRLTHWMFPADDVQSGMLFAVGWLGMLLLLVVTGFETDLGLIRRLGRATIWVTIGSLVIPFGLGLALGYAMPRSLTGDGPEGAGQGPHVFALFVAISLSISALPVVAKILTDLGLMRRNFGQLTLAVAMANDVISWVALGVIAGVAADGHFHAGHFATTLLWLALFLAATALIGQRVIDAVLHGMRRWQIGRGGWVTVILGLMLVLGAITQGLGVEAVLGAFIAGILIGRSRYTPHESRDDIEVFTSSFLAPVFFATAGLRVDLGVLSSPKVGFWTVVMVAIATIGKIGGSWLGARFAGLVNREGLALGAGLNARGAVDIVVATVGLSLGVFNEASYTIVVLMSIATSLMASPLLRAVVRGWPGTPEEATRLQREAQFADNVLLKPGRVLMPVAGGPATEYAATVIDAALPPESPVTIADLGSDDPLELVGTAQSFAHRPLESMRVAGDNVARVLQRAGMGYDMLVTVTDATSTRDLDPLVDALIRESPLPTVVIRPPAGELRPVQRVLLPISTTRPARASAEVAIAIAQRLAARLDLIYVSPASAADPPGMAAAALANLPGLGSLARHDEVGRKLMDTVAGMAHAARVWPRRLFVEHDSRGPGIVETARQRQIDLVVIGVDAQEVDERTYLGQTATHLLAAADLGLVVVALGPR